jgi:zinc/manganese transport system ATP-binding protein
MTTMTGGGLDRVPPLDTGPVREPGAGQAPPPVSAEGAGTRRAVAGDLGTGTGTPAAAAPGTAARSAATPDTATPEATAPDTATSRPFSPEATAAGTADRGARAADPGSGVALELRAAAVRVGERTLWSGVDLRVRAGEFVAVLGPNGAGKSTLVKAVLGLVPLAGGTLRALGRPTGEANDRIGYLPQRRSFDARLRVRGRDVVRLGLDGNRWGVPLPGARLWSRRARADHARVCEVLALVGAEGYADRPVGELSGGEQQRLLIAQALASRPRMLLLDEPLDSLDLPNQGAVAGLISRVCREDGVTVLMVAHDVNPILGYLDRVVYIAAGGVAAGTPREVINGETLSRLYGTPIEVLSTSDGRLVVVGGPEAPALHTDRHAGAGPVP